MGSSKGRVRNEAMYTINEYYIKNNCYSCDRRNNQVDLESRKNMYEWNHDVSQSLSASK